MKVDLANNASILKQAEKNGERLLADLLHHQKNLTADWSRVLSSEELTHGRLAIDAAVTSVRKLLGDFIDAQKMRPVE
jgi:hypothetical protein